MLWCRIDLQSKHFILQQFLNNSQWLKQLYLNTGDMEVQRGREFGRSGTDLHWTGCCWNTVNANKQLFWQKSSCPEKKALPQNRQLQARSLQQKKIESFMVRWQRDQLFPTMTQKMTTELLHSENIVLMVKGALGMFCCQGSYITEVHINFKYRC